MEWFDLTDPDQLVIMASVLAVGMAKEMTTNEINAFGNFLQMLGQNLEVIATQQTLNKDVIEKDNCSSQNVHQ